MHTHEAIISKDMFETDKKIRAEEGVDTSVDIFTGPGGVADD